MEKNFIEELKNILNSNLPNEEKKNNILQYHENDIAEFMAELKSEEKEKLFEILGAEAFAEVLVYSDDIESIVEEMTNEEAAQIIENLDADDAIDVLDELKDDDKREEIVALLNEDIREDLEVINTYDDDQIGSKMTTNFITIGKNDTIKQAMKKLVSEAAENDNVSTIYVLDEDNTFYGAVTLRDLIIARDTDVLEKIVMTNYPVFYAENSVSDCLISMKEYAEDSYPILNVKKELIGVITSDDVVEAVDEELGDDYAKLAGLTGEEEKNESTFYSVKKRIPWLIILMFLGLIQAITMTGFERIVATLPVIVFFQTLVLDMAGNSGTQSLAVTIRKISSGECSGKEVVLALLKEFGIGVINGVVLSVLSFGLVFLFMRLTNQGVVENSSFETIQALKASLIVSLALMIAMTISSLVGTLVPIIFLKLKVDPAVASGPFITSINDVSAILIYYGLAALFFQALL